MFPYGVAVQQAAVLARPPLAAVAVLPIAVAVPVMSLPRDAVRA
jgi:hypothetical protein